MDDEKSSAGSQTAQPTDLYLDWYAMQFYCKARGTNEIVQRSFPFWAPSIEFAIDHAKKSNKLSKEERTHWSHLRIYQHIRETKDGAHELSHGDNEVKI